MDSAAQPSFRFDVRDVRFWVGFAAHAGVAHVPFREVLRLSEDEVSALSGQISLPDIATVRRFSGNMRAAETILRKETPREGGAGIQTRDSSEEKGSAEHLAKTDVSTISEKTAAALDDLPAGWMVRHSCCSSEATKIFMNMGIGDASALLDGLRVTETAKIGPGWIQIGNRRMVDVTDARILKVGIASGPGGDQVFVARPWRPSDRKLVGIDPHRKDTSLRAEGVWPAEWRAFIRNGIVEGVSGYYAWSHPRDAHDAAMALAVRAAAEKVVAAAIALRAQPVFMDAELRRAAASMRDRKRGWEQGGEGDAGECSGFDATIDFVESCDENGVWRPVLLEGGPGFHAFGGGHPCGFTGLRRPEGVALGVMPDADLMNPGRHVEDPSRSSAGIVFGWDEIADLASKFDGKIAVLEAEWPKQALDRPSACQAVESGATTISP
ncbi:MAG: hypothetical protein ING19_11635 [Azospirillum sp.]|nr:hypothetical protein [Azospirillum sp.]